jgi:hypothetical protein
MLREIIDDIIEKLAEKQVAPVYSAFDARSLDRKGSSFFTIVGINSFESSQPIYSQYKVYIPFKSEIELTVAAPDSCSMTELYDYYDTDIEPVIFDMSGLTCTLAKMSVKFDNNIQRLVLSVRIAASGITSAERSNL